MTEMTNPAPSDPAGPSAMDEGSTLANGSEQLLDGGSTGTDEGPAGLPANLVGQDRDGDPVDAPPAARPDGPSGGIDQHGPRRGGRPAVADRHLDAVAGVGRPQRLGVRDAAGRRPGLSDAWVERPAAVRAVGRAERTAGLSGRRAGGLQRHVGRSARRAERRPAAAGRTCRSA